MAPDKKKNLLTEWLDSLENGGHYDMPLDTVVFYCIDSMYYPDAPPDDPERIIPPSMEEFPFPVRYWASAYEFLAELDRQN